jgi:phosphoribosylamine--glycine ligase
MSERLKIVVVGKGGREHALVRALADSSSAPEVWCWPGSDAIRAIAPTPAVKDIAGLLAWMKSDGVGLCVAGEESYLVLGLADECRRIGVPVWGPVKDSARLESSKIFAKEFLQRNRIPTGDFTIVSTADELRAAAVKLPTVLKYNGLAAGKGVAVCFTPAQVEEFTDEIFVQQRFGNDRVFVEEFLEGPEVSVICAVCDDHHLLFTPARDYKRLVDGDLGPNTGGMGAVASRDLLPPGLLEHIDRDIVAPTVAALRRDRLDYRGFLYFGIMLTKDGPKMLEFNCRFGDPEAEAVLPMIRGDFAGFLLDAARGEWRPDRIDSAPGWSICVVKASRDYPASSSRGGVIHGLDQVSPDARVYHSGTFRNADGAYEVNGGRVLVIQAAGATRAEAVAAVYHEADKVSFDGARGRRDVGTLHFT